MSHVSLSSRGSRGRRGSGLSSNHVTLFLGLAVGVFRRAIARDVAGLATSIARLSGGVKRASVRSSTVTRDVSEFTASVALHGLGLAIASEVIRPAALVAGGAGGASIEATTRSEATTSITATGNWSSPSKIGSGRVGAVASEMSGKTACIAGAAGWVRAVQAEGRAVSLDVAQTLAVVALLRFGGARQRALARLVVWLLAVVAETVG